MEDQRIKTTQETAEGVGRKIVRGNKNSIVGQIQKLSLRWRQHFNASWEKDCECEASTQVVSETTDSSVCWVIFKKLYINWDSTCVFISRRNPSGNMDGSIVRVANESNKCSPPPHVCSAALPSLRLLQTENNCKSRLRWRISQHTLHSLNLACHSHSFKTSINKSLRTTRIIEIGVSILEMRFRKWKINTKKNLYIK